MTFCSASPSVTVLFQRPLVGSSPCNAYLDLRCPIFIAGSRLLDFCLSEVDNDERLIPFAQNVVPGVDVVVRAPMARSPVMWLDILATSCSETSIPGRSLSILMPGIDSRASPLTTSVMGCRNERCQKDGEYTGYTGLAKDAKADTQRTPCRTTLSSQIKPRPPTSNPPKVSCLSKSFDLEPVWNCTRSNITGGAS